MTRFFCILGGLALFGLSLVGTMISVELSSDYFSNAIDIPKSGLIGLVVSGSVLVLGFIAPLLAAQKIRNMAIAASFGLLCMCVVDGWSNVNAQGDKVAQATQETADRNAAYKTAIDALPSVVDRIKEFEATKAEMNLALKEGDIRKSVPSVLTAQNTLFVNGLKIKRDGVLGQNTEAAISAYALKVGDALPGLYESKASYEAIKRKGADIVGQTFTNKHAMAYGIGLTIVSLLLSFFGGLLCTIRDPEEEKATAMIPERIGNILSAVERINQRFGQAA